MMAKELEEHQVPHKLLSIPGAEHGLAGGDPKLIDAAYEQAFAFIEQHMQP